MKKRLTYSLFLAIFSFAISCKKESDPTPTPLTRTELLTSKSWNWIAASVTPAYDVFGDGKPVSGDYFSKSPTCWKDDIWIFVAGGKFTHDEGTTKCAAADPQIYDQGTWKFETAENSIRINTSVAGETVWGINELTATSLKVVEFYTENGKTYTFQYSFSR